MDLKLLYAESSNCAQRIFWALNYKLIPFELLKYEDLDKEQLRGLSPFGSVPVLFIGDECLSESVAILEWLEDNYPNPPIFPKNILERARVREVVETINSTIHPGQQTSTQRFFLPDVGSEVLRDSRRRWMELNLRAITRLLFLKSQFAVGESFSAADLFLVPIICKAYKLGVEIKFVFPQFAKYLLFLEQKKELMDSCPVEAVAVIKEINHSST